VAREGQADRPRPATRRPVPTRLGDYTVGPRMLLIAALAVPVGLLSGAVAFALLRLIGLITNAVFFGRLGTGLVAPGSGHHPWYVILVAPVAGGLLVGVLARYGSEKIRGHGIPEAIEAILTGGSKIDPKVSLLKPTSSAITIGTGGPFGAEGPIIMTGGAFGSLLAQFLRLTADERKTLLVAGATGGMAATFNAPLASVLLAVELLLFEWRPRSYVPVAVAVVTGTVVRRYLLGGGALFRVPTTTLHLSLSVDALCLVSGIVAGILAVVATTLVYASEDGFHRLPIHWMWWPAIGGLIIGVGGLIVPQALGVGYNVIDEELTGRITLGLVIGILICKTLIWSLSLGSGTSGGVLAPMFMIGGALGSLEGTVFPHVGPGFWALVGLAGVLGGVMRSPFTGIVFPIELTHQIGALLPLTISASVAYGVSALVLKRSVLTEKVARRGYHLTREYDVDPLEVLFVRDVMAGDVVSFSSGTPVRAVARMLTQRPSAGDPRLTRQRLYPVLLGQDGELGRLFGVVTRRSLLEPDSARRTVDDVAVRDPVVAYPDETLRAIAYRMAEHGLTRLPVVARDDPRHVLGLVTLAQLLQGRLVDLEEARSAERVLTVRALLPSRTGRLRVRRQADVEVRRDEVADTTDQPVH
jgi:CIC family chloride channel protein